MEQIEVKVKRGFYYKGKEIHPEKDPKKPPVLVKLPKPFALEMIAADKAERPSDDDETAPVKKKGKGDDG